MNKIKYNKSTFCILPILNVARDDLYWNFFFLNCYISIKEHPELNNHFFLLFQFKNNDSYITVKEKLIIHELFDSEIEHNKFNIFVFKIPKDFKRDVKLFKLGKYSKFSREYKNMIFEVHEVIQKDLLFHILNKTAERRLKLSKKLNHDIPEDVELWALPHDHDEVLILKNLK